ncbi:MAG: bifunctional metallophosphatase/5'-nucleotidase [Alphaproteobacteria bacterium]|nr:bifunctional metallophosphatase/5'-nucleotidase [Alphaproteobacteria bacterium]
MTEQNGRGGYARVAGAFNAERARGGTVITVHAGDALSPCLMCSFDSGEHAVDLMNRIGFDIFVPGNHEYDFGRDIYLKRMSEARFPILAANLRDARGQPLPGHEDHRIVEAEGIRIGIIGLTAEDSHEKSNPGDLKIAGVRATLEQKAKELRTQGAQLIVAVVHAQRGIDNTIHDLGIADIVLSGDDHDIRYIYNGKTVLMEGGEDGLYVLALEISFNAPAKPGARLEWKPRVRIIDTADVAPDPAIAARVAHYESLLSRELDVELATLAAPLDSRSASVRAGEAAWGNLITDAIRTSTGADIAVMNGGGIRGNARYETGHRLTRRHILSELPFGNKTLVFRLTGAQLKAALEHGFGEFPRPAGQFLHVSGARIVIDGSRKPGERVTSIEVAGAPVDPKQYYTVAASDFFLRGGDGFTQFTEQALRTRVEDALLIANDVMVYVRKLGTINARAEGRVRTR